MTYEIRTTDVFDGLAAMPERSVHCCVTSPPYWALRDYGTAKWEGGDAGCDHARTQLASKSVASSTLGPPGQQGGSWHLDTFRGKSQQYRDTCGKCGAKRIDRQLGQEATPQEFVATLVRVFAGVWRVLRDDGVLFVNLGDSYCNTDKWGGGGKNTGKHSTNGDEVPSWAVRAKKPSVTGIKPKDRCLIPERFVIAMQEFGWYVRDIIIWHKPAPMPVSVRDRCTPAWEPIYQFTKSPRYFWDQEAVKVPAVYPNDARHLRRDLRKEIDPMCIDNGSRARTGNISATANPRNVWRISTEPLKAKHYAAFPSELPTRCIKAATSERGVCSKCLSPWVRVVERNRVATRPGVQSKVNIEDYGKTMYPDDHPNQRHSGDVCGNRDPQRHCTATTTAGWAKSCECVAETIPATVLDPFSGAGTTCLAAHRLGRHGIGLELNPEYCKIAIERIESDRPEDIEPTPTMLFDIAEQQELFQEQP